MKIPCFLLLILLAGFPTIMPAQIVINEACTHNGSLVKDEDDDDPDWLEFYNTGTTGTDLFGYSLLDGSGIAWTFPQLILPARSHLLVFASGKDRKGSVLHTSFKLSKEGELISLLDASGNKADEIRIPPLHLDHSFGCQPDGSTSARGIFTEPTPGTRNDTSDFYEAYAVNPVFSFQPGFYPSPISLLLSQGQAADEIRYTTDGSLPDRTSELYTSPLSIDSCLVIRAQAFSERSGILSSEIITGSYFIGFTSDLPVVSISTDPGNLWDWNSGIYVFGPNASPVYPYFGANFWQDWEKPAHVEIFEKSRIKVLEQDAGLSINGGSVSRTRPQQSLRLTARDKYGTPDFHYRFFEEKNIDRFKNIVLRNSSGDFNKTHFRDGSLHKLMLGHIDIDLLCYRPAVVFLNGKYWGVENIREKFSKFYLEENYGIDPEQLDLLEEDSTTIQGDFTSFNAMHHFVTTAGMQVPGNYDSACRMIDISSFCDYFIAETFLSNIDWPYNNIKYWKAKTPGAKWRYLLMDLDISLGNYGWAPAGMDVFGRLLGPYGDNNKHVQLLKNLLRNTGFRVYFINRYADLVNTLFTSQNMKDNTLEVKNNLESEMPRHFSRWGNSTETWNHEIDSVVMPYIEERPEFAMKYLGEYFGMNKQVQLDLEVWPPAAGSVRINTIKPLLPWTGNYFDGNPITLTVLPNPGFTFNGWYIDEQQLGNSHSQSVNINLEKSCHIKAYFGSGSISTQLTLFPNPARNQVNTEFVINNPVSGMVSVYNLQGKELIRSTETAFTTGLNHANVDVSGLASGVYFLQLLTAEGKKTARFVIIH